MIHWNKRPFALLGLVVLAAAIAATGGAIHWDIVSAGL
jgi:hypothetical protein